jgi:hypothetical protein
MTHNSSNNTTKEAKMAKVIDFHVVSVEQGHHGQRYYYNITLSNGKVLCSIIPFHTKEEALYHGRHKMDLKVNELDLGKYRSSSQ